MRSNDAWSDGDPKERYPKERIDVSVTKETQTIR
jgi:hypothetical protein